MDAGSSTLCSELFQFRVRSVKATLENAVCTIQFYQGEFFKSRLLYLKNHTVFV